MRSRHTHRTRSGPTGRITILITTVLALLMATFAKGGMVLLGALAISLSLQLWPALMAVTRFPWLSRQGVTAGLIVGVIVVWIFFSTGPGIVIGNNIFGAPGAGYDGWDFAMPSIWAWQLLWWGLGVLLIWFLAYKMEMSTVPHKEVLPLAEDVSQTLDTIARTRQHEGVHVSQNRMGEYGFARK